MNSVIRLVLSYMVLGTVSLWSQNDNAAVASIRSLNEQILSSPQGRNAEQALKKRLPLFQSLIRSNPDLALSLAFSDDTVASLRSANLSIAPPVEIRGEWVGEGFPLVEDAKDPRTSRIYLRLHSSEGDLNIHLGRGSAPMPPGSGRFRVEGVRAGEDVAAAKMIPLPRAASADTCSATGDQKTIGILVKVPN